MLSEQNRAKKKGCLAAREAEEVDEEGFAYSILYPQKDVNSSEKPLQEDEELSQQLRIHFRRRCLYRRLLLNFESVLLPHPRTEPSQSMCPDDEALPDKELGLDGVAPPPLVKLHKQLAKRSELRELHLKHHLTIT